MTGEIQAPTSRIDLIEADLTREIIVEVKAIERFSPVHESQLLTYLRLSKIRVGLLINFNVPVLRKGVIRRVL
jgi:GxxExxY protein